MTDHLSTFYGPPYMYMNFDKDWQWGTSQVNIGGVPMIRLSKSSIDRGEGSTIDTGLGTASNQDEAMATGEDKRITGTAHTYSDVTVSSESNLSEEEDESSVKLAPTSRLTDQYRLDLDSDAAQRVDENYRQIMKKKRGGYLEALRASKGPNMSDAESIKTEDFEAKFKAIMDNNGAALAPWLRMPQTNRMSILSPAVNGTLPFSDMESMQTLGTMFPEDLLQVNKDGHPGTGSPSKGQGQMKGLGSKKSKKSKVNGQSDHDSVQTEDFEYLFHDMMVKQVAQVPITSFDQFIVDSDLDTVKSALIKNKFKKALQNMADHSELSSSDTESTPRFHDRKPDKKRPGDGSHLPTAAWVVPQQVQSMQSLPPGSMVHIPYQVMNPHSHPGLQGHSRNKVNRHTPKRTGSSRLKSSSNHSLPTEDFPEETADDISRETARIRQEMDDERRLKVCSQRPGGVSMAAGSGAISMSTPNLHLMNHSNYDNDRYIGTNQMAMEKAEDNRLHLVQELNKLTTAVTKAKCDKQGALMELKSVQEKLRQHRAEVRQMDQQIKENRAKAENARTDLMLLEFKRDSCKKELNRTSEEVERRKSALEEKGFRSTEELAAMRTENETLKLKADHSERLQREVEELERQLDSKKESQFVEQKKLRARVEELEEELEARGQALEEASREKDTTQHRLNKLDIKFKAMEKTKAALIEEKTTDLEELRERLQEQITEAKADHAREATELRTQLSDVMSKMDAATKQAFEREETTMTLKEKVLEKDHELQQFADKIQAIREEHKKSSDGIRANFKREIEEALTSVRLALEKDKREALEQLEADLEDRYTTDLDQLEVSLRTEISTLQGQLTGKEVEIGVLRDRVCQHEEAAKTLGDVLRKEAQQKVQSAVDAEKERSSGERERAIREAISTAIPDHERLIRSLREQLGASQDAAEQHSRQLNNVKQELEEARTQNRQLYMEKLSAMNQAKESAQQEKDRQLDALKEQIEKETMRQIERLRETIVRQEEEIMRLRAEKTEVTQSQQENLSLIGRQEKMVIQEINDECAKTAELLGVIPRKVVIPSFGSNWTQTKSGTYSAQGPLKTALAASLANLRASHDELRKHVIEVKTDLANQKLSLAQAYQTKSQEIEAIKQKLNAEKTSAMVALKDRLIKEHLQEVGRFTKTSGSEDSLQRSLREKDSELTEILRNMAHWKEHTAEKLAHKFSEEMDREVEKRLKEHRRAEREWEQDRSNSQREMERMEREIQRRHPAAGVQTPSARPPPVPETSKTVQLQAQLRHLQSENASLRSTTWRRSAANSSSTPDLTSVGITAPPYTPTASAFLTHNSLPTSPASTASRIPLTGSGPASLGTLEERVRQAERRAQLAEGRACRNEQMLTSTRSELSKVHGNMNQKSRELMQLERQYNQLQHHSPLR